MHGVFECQHKKIQVKFLIVCSLWNGDILIYYATNFSFYVRRGEPVDVSISFQLKPNAKKVIGLLASFTPRCGDLIIARRECVQMLLHLVPVRIYA